LKKSERNRLDTLWSNKIHESDESCRVCRRQDRKLEAAHIVGRGAYNTRWRLDNGILLCFTCHQDYDQHRNHMEDKIRRIIGEDKWDELQKLGTEVGKKYFYDEVLERINGKS